ncbi:RNA-guided endonuclease InsQ/TnpB family protein [Veronia pacifica]|uniref:Cas12f1-like TNB domain-containing protein n=1 Tax=Veronia pacifica TaxID=1080227 RepID=A0A1C3E4L3_9GAMM|nr:RNA-guided endonuclease TnpB family protein [Veronia pacifica]ODA28195.1 hypothetical protein A8L45_23245 [Veronia pacifica]
MKPFNVFKTHTFKLHNLTAKKKALLDKTFKQNEMAYFKALEAVKDDAEALIPLDKKERKQGVAAIKKKLQAIVKPLPFGNALKAAVIEDVAAQVSSYVELTLSGQDAGYPTRIEAEHQYHEALNDLLRSMSKEEEDKARDEMARAACNKVRPLSFYKYRVSDGFMLLADDKNRVFTFLNLWGARDKRATRLVMDMVDTRTGEPFKTSTGTGLLMPLAYSDWHTDAITVGNAKSAKLYERGGEYYLAVAVEYVVERRETSAVMGIDCGIDEIASYAVRNNSGQVIATGTFDGKVLREHQRKLENKQKMGQKKGKALVQAWSNYSDNLVHHIANAIVDVAEKYNAEVVMEDLIGIKNNPHQKRKKGGRKLALRRQLSRQQYGKLENMLEYKLNMKGIPKPSLVHAAYTSLTCPSCGHSDKTNRPERDTFRCGQCDYNNHADINAAINIAGKKIWLEANKTKLKKDLPDHLKFSKWQAVNLSLD